MADGVGTGGEGSGGGGGGGEGLHVCVTCGRTDSPEWRKGPLGPKTLCNVSVTLFGRVARCRAMSDAWWRWSTFAGQWFDG